MANSDYYAKRCLWCATQLKLVFTSWYCPFCEDDDNKHRTALFAYALASPNWLEQYHTKGVNVIPWNTRVYLYKDKKTAQFVQANGPNNILLIVNVTFERDFIWSTMLDGHPHVTKRDLPFEFYDDA